jgi:hypothetical protein
MTLFHEVGTAVLMVIVTLWLQCAGVAALIVWVRHAVSADVRILGPFPSAAHWSCVLQQRSLFSMEC